MDFGAKFMALFILAFLLIGAFVTTTLFSEEQRETSCDCPESFEKKECPPPNCQKNTLSPEQKRRKRLEGEEGESEKEKEKPFCEYLSQIERGSWKNVSWYEPETCQIRDIQKEEALNCFAGKSVSFIGDSTMGGIFRVSPAIFGKMHEYGVDFDRDEMRRKGSTDQDLRFLQPTSFFQEEKKIHMRHWRMWRQEMWDTYGYGNTPDNVNTTIPDVFTNSSIHLVFINIASHVQNKEMQWGVIPYLNLVEKIAKFHHEKGERKEFITPIVWISMNAQNAKQKSPERGYQDVRYSSIFNELAHWIFERFQPEIPMIDFHEMIKVGFPFTTGDGIHSSREVNIMKWKIILHFICGKGRFDLDFKLREP